MKTKKATVNSPEEKNNLQRLRGRYEATVSLGYSHKGTERTYDMRILAGLGNMYLSMGLVGLGFTHDKKMHITKGITNEEGKLYEYWLIWDRSGPVPQLVWSCDPTIITDENLFVIDIEIPDHMLGRTQR